MTGAKRGQDVVARVGGDEFALLAVECDRPGAEMLAKRLREALLAAGIRASLGHSMRVASKGLSSAWEEADKAMYADKERSRRERGTAAIGAQAEDPAKADTST